MKDWLAYFIIGSFWVFYISANCVYLHMKGFTVIESGVYAWGIFFIAHVFYELPYMLYYSFSTSYYASPIALYMSFTGCYFMFWVSRHYHGSMNLFREGIPVEMFLSSLILIFAFSSGTNILSGNYGMTVFCWASRVIAVIYTWSIPYNLGGFKDDEAGNAKLRSPS